MIKAIMYDLDGVLVEACEWHYIALNKALIESGYGEIVREEHLAVFNGRPTKVKLDMLFKLGRIKELDIPRLERLKQDLTLQTIRDTALIDEEKIKLHVYFHGIGIKIACVTNSIRKSAELMLRQTGQFEFMDLIISNEMVNNNKPDPECYLLAMQELNVKPEETLIVEDSPLGVQSAQRSGAFVLKVKDASEVNVDRVHCAYTLFDYR